MHRHKYYGAGVMANHGPQAWEPPSASKNLATNTNSFITKSLNLRYEENIWINK
jgi:hypothetical protein